MGWFNFDDPGLLGQMEEHGYMTTSDEEIHLVDAENGNVHYVPKRSLEEIIL